MAIDWDFGPDVPTDDLLESLDLDDLGGVVEVLERFVDEMTSDRYRSWEAVIRSEQGLRSTIFMNSLADDALDFCDEGERVLYIDEMPRPSEPWYAVLRRIAPRLLLEPFRTADVHEDGITEIWQSVLVALENHGRGLSLPDGVSQPLEVLPAER